MEIRKRNKQQINMAARKFISWRRVSTFKQNSSGLGLLAQKEIIKYFIERERGEWVADYEECYTGTELSGCVELHKAMEHAKREDAVLIIAKTDRFRNTAEALQVYEEMGDNNLLFCDLPHTDKFTLTLFFALAEREALIVSIRTKQALDAKKKRGEKTGGATDKWRDAYNAKSKEQKSKENSMRGSTKNSRHLQSKEVQVFIKVLRNVFPAATQSNNLIEWDWSQITTKNGIRQKVLGLMRDYRDLDPTLWRKWPLDDLDYWKLQAKLGAHIQALRNAVFTQSRYNEQQNIYGNNKHLSALARG